MEVWRSATSQVKRTNVQRITVNLGFSRHPSTPSPPEPRAVIFPSASTLKKLWELSHNLGKVLAPPLIIYLWITTLDVHLHPERYYPGKHSGEELILEPVWHLMPKNVRCDLKNMWSEKLWKKKQPHSSNLWMNVSSYQLPVTVTSFIERHELVQKQRSVASF